MPDPRLHRAQRGHQPGRSGRSPRDPADDPGAANRPHGGSGLDRAPPPSGRPRCHSGAGRSRRGRAVSTQESPVRSFRRVIGEVGAAVAARPGRPLRQRLRLPLMLAGPLVVLIAASWWYLTSGRYVSTDDAYVQAARTMISTDVAGRVIAVLVHDNQRVAKGELMV